MKKKVLLLFGATTCVCVTVYAVRWQLQSASSSRNATTNDLLSLRSDISTISDMQEKRIIDAINATENRIIAKIEDSMSNLSKLMAPHR